MSAKRSRSRPQRRNGRQPDGQGPGGRLPQDAALAGAVHRAGVPGRPWLSTLVLHPDLAWPEFRVAVEYDGQWHADSDQLHRDRRRLNQLVAAGWIVLHVTSRRFRNDFPPLLREIRTALAARGWRR